jgi:uncharacterized protein (TIGR01777 family)
MKVVLTGSSGLVGSALVPALRAGGHEIVRLVRREPRGVGEVRWDPAAGTIDAAGLAGVDAAVHLAGAGIGSRRLTRRYRRVVIDSRVQGTGLLARTLADLDPRPHTLLSASGVGWYGSPGSRPVDESEPAGDGFLADLVRAWEASTKPAEDAGIRVCHLRSGEILSTRGGAAQLQILVFRAGLGGRLGSGKQYVSWISLPDEIAAIRFLLGDPGAGSPESLDVPQSPGSAGSGEPRQSRGSPADGPGTNISGPVNLVAPGAVTNAEFTKALGAALHRPSFWIVPAPALRLVLGRGLADDVVLVSQRVTPGVLTSAGFAFAHPQLRGALNAMVAERT